MFKRTLLTTVTALVVGAIFAPSVSAATASYEGGVFRYRAQPGDSVNSFVMGFRRGDADWMRGDLVGFTTTAVNAGRGCRAGPHGDSLDVVEVVCARGASGEAAGVPRYRLSLNERDNNVGVLGAHFSGVIYSGAGNDSADTEDQRRSAIYGGRGDDSLVGLRAYGGQGDDRLIANPIPSSESGGRAILRGGTGDDTIDVDSTRGGWGYGGPGRDFLTDSRHADMLIGGRGRDRVVLLYANDSSRNVVRVRGGGSDFVVCAGGADARDVIFLDAADGVEPSCRGARILLTGRPRYLR